MLTLSNDQNENKFFLHENFQVYFKHCREKYTFWHYQVYLQNSQNERIQWL